VTRLIAILMSIFLSAPAMAEAVKPGTGAVLRGLNKVDGTIANMDLSNSETQTMGRLEITLRECRYPADDPAGDAYALLLIREDGEKVFEGWMVASSPALNALEHPRYDIWVMRCKTA